MRARVGRISVRSVHVRILSCVAGITLHVLHAAPAMAQNAFRYSAPTECPTQSQTTTRFATLLGDDFATRMQSARQAIDWTITHDGHQYLSRVWLQIGVHDELDPAGLRETRGANCEALVEAGVLTLAMTLDPERTEQYLEAHPETSPEETRTEATVVAHEEAPPTPSEPARDPGHSEPLRFSLGLAGGVDFALFTVPGPSLSIPIRLEWSLLQITLLPRYYLPFFALSSPFGPYDLQAWSGALETGLRILSVAGLTLHPFVRLDVGGIAVRFREVTQNAAFVFGAIGLNLGWHIENFGIELSGSLSTAWLRTIIDIGGQRIFTQPDVNGSVELRLLMRF